MGTGTNLPETNLKVTRFLLRRVATVLACMALLHLVGQVTPLTGIPSGLEWVAAARADGGGDSDGGGGSDGGGSGSDSDSDSDGDSDSGGSGNSGHGGHSGSGGGSNSGHGSGSGSGKSFSPGDLSRHGGISASKVSAEAISVQYTDGWRETLSRSTYRLLDRKGRVVISRPARRSDWARLARLIGR